jgi:ribosome-interacting GTPase 1
MMLDVGKGKSQKKVLSRELEQMGIRINKKQPKIYITKKTGKVSGGANTGIIYTSTVKQTKGISERLVKDILHHQYSFFFFIFLIFFKF